MEIRHNPEGQRFQLWDARGQEVGAIEYRVDGGDLYATHTEVDPAHEGNGYAARLLDALTAYAREQGMKIIPVCSYVDAKFRKNPEKYADVLR